MPYNEQDFADMLFAWPAVEGRIIHLYELDPTHRAAEPSGSMNISASTAPALQPSRSAAPFCTLGDFAPVAVMLELDPTH